MTTYTLNKEFNGIEITFDSKPAAEIRSTLKANGFRWHKVKGLWYAKNTPERLEMAQSMGTLEEVYKYADKVREEEKPAPAYGKGKKKAAITEHSFKVGDILYSSWGYEQTNIDLYQVVALKGKSMITVKPCRLATTGEDYISGMSRDITFQLPENGEIIADEDAEPITRKVKNYSKDRKAEEDFIAINSFANAHRYSGQALYESWYY